MGRSLFLDRLYPVNIVRSSIFHFAWTQTKQVWFDVAEPDNPADFFPFLLNFPNERLNTAKQCGHVFEKFTMDMIEKYGQTCLGEPEQHATDDTRLSLFDVLVRQYAKRNTAPLTRPEKLRLAKILSDFVGGGFDTGAATLSWALLYLISAPDILQKCRAELREQTALRPLSTTMMKTTPYFMATLYDIYRMSSVAPLGLAHEVAADTVLMGCRIPKGNWIELLSYQKYKKYVKINYKLINNQILTITMHSTTFTTYT